MTSRALLFEEQDHTGILVSASGWQQTVTATTDSSGSYTLDDLAEGYNVVSFKREGFAEVIRSLVLPGGQGLTLSETTLFRRGAIVGRVLRPDGQPAKGAVVLLCQSNPPPGFGGSWKVIADGQGRYRSPTDPGFHQVTAFISDESLVGEGREGGFGVTVLVNPGQEATAEDMMLRRYNVPAKTLVGSGCE